MNGTNDKQKEDPGLHFPGRGECCKGSDQSGAPAPRSALAWTGRCLRVDLAPWRTEKLHFWNSIRAIWYILFGNILLKKSFKVNYWMNYHVWRSSHFSCFDAFVRTLINLWKFKKRVSEGEFPLRSWKTCNFQTQLGAYLFWTFFKLNLKNLVHIFCQHFTENPLFFPIKYWLLLCLFLPPFHSSFMILVIIMSIPLTGSKASSSCLTKNILSEVKCIISGPSVV